MNRSVFAILLYSIFSALALANETTENELQELERSAQVVLERKKLIEENERLRNQLIINENERLKAENAQLKNNNNTVRIYSPQVTSKRNSGLYVGAGTSINGSGTLNEVITVSSFSYFDIVEYAYEYEKKMTDFKLGFIFNSNNRVEISLQSDTADIGLLELKYKTTSIDWLFTLNSFNDANIYPFVLLGFGRSVWNDSMNLFPIEKDLIGIGLNSGIGILVGFDHSEIELSYRLNVTAWQEVSYYVSSYEVTRQYTNQITYGYVSYKFIF